MKNNLDFGGQHVRAFQSVADIVVVIVCPDDVNPELNLSGAPRGEMPLSFSDGQSRWPFEAVDTKRRTPEEITRLVRSYLPSKWTLLLSGLSAVIPAICADGFKGSRIITLNDDNNRENILSKWVKGHQGASITYPHGTSGGNDFGWSDDHGTGEGQAMEDVNGGAEERRGSELEQVSPLRGNMSTDSVEDIEQVKSPSIPLFRIIRGKQGLTTIPYHTNAQSVIQSSRDKRKATREGTGQRLQGPPSEFVQVEVEARKQYSIGSGNSQLGRPAEG